MNEHWRAGAATIEFPVPMGTPMAGYAARVGVSTGTLDPLTVTALALEAAGTRLVIVAADIAAVDSALTTTIASSAGLRRDELLLAASHTHSGPAGICHPLHLSAGGAIDWQLRKQFSGTCAEAIVTALARMEPATVAFGRSPTSRLAGNRHDPDWSDRNPSDPGISILQVESFLGEPLGVIAHWACHPTILGAENTLISADFPGALRRRIRKTLDRCALPVLYLNGAAGDISTRFTRRAQTPREVERIGGRLATAARRARPRSNMLSPVLDHRSRLVTLEGWSEAELNAARGAREEEPGAHGEDRRQITRQQGVEMLDALEASACRPRRKRIRLDGWRVGEVVLIAIPGELFLDLGHEIERSTSGDVIVVGYAGGYCGYLPNREAYTAGAYEALASRFGPGCGEQVRDAAMSLFRYPPMETGG